MRLSLGTFSEIALGTTASASSDVPLILIIFPANLSRRSTVEIVNVGDLPPRP